jgi:hypothetical protein
VNLAIHATDSRHGADPRFDADFFQKLKSLSQGADCLYLPAAIVLVLLPKMSAREAGGRDTSDMLAKSLLVTLAFCGAAVAVYAAAPELILSVAFGESYEDASSYLWLFAVAMACYAVLNVFLAYHLGRGEAQFSWILLGGAAVQIGLFALFHDSPRELLVADIAVAVGLLALHELFVEPVFRTLVRKRLGRHAR